nr:VWA domain-containing protein [Sphingomonas sp. Y57]
MSPGSFTALLASAALLVSAAPPPPVPPAHGPAVRPSETPVRCRMEAPASDAIGTGGKRILRHPGPPAPPPPSMVSAPLASPAIAATAQRRFEAPYGSAANRERYDGREVASIRDVATSPVSTFSIDVDTGSYANVRRFLEDGQPVPAEAVRTEEMINYFRYDYPRPVDRSTPFSVTTDVSTTPWNPATRLIRIGLRGYDLATADRPPANLVFLVDTSGSMFSPDKLPLVKTALKGLAGQLRPDDRVSIVAYAGSAGVVLESTNRFGYIDAALDCLQAGGSTAGGQGIELAYAIARANFRKDGVNRIFLATDGDFNVGISDNKALEALVKRNRDDGITLTALGFGTGNYNEAMMERIADVGNGNYAYVDSAMEAKKVLSEELSATLVTIAKDVKVQVEFNPAAISQYRLIGYENRALAEEDFANDAVDAGDMGAGHQVTALYEVVPAGASDWTAERRYEANRPRSAPSKGQEAAFVKLRYKLPDGGASREISRAVPAAALTTATEPRGDMAFVTAVAAFGQKLRGDAHLGGFGFADIRTLAAGQGDFWRQQFGKLTELAER